MSAYQHQLDALMAGTLSASEFNHKAHVGVTFEALQRFEFFEAMQVIVTGLRNLAARAGVPDKFNATITMAYLSVIAERMASDPCPDADAFVARNEDLLGLACLASRYPSSRLSSDLARRIALLPY